MRRTTRSRASTLEMWVQALCRLLCRLLLTPGHDSHHPHKLLLRRLLLLNRFTRSLTLQARGGLGCRRGSPARSLAGLRSDPLTGYHGFNLPLGNLQSAQGV